MQARETTTTNGNRHLQSDLLLLALHIAVPVGLSILSAVACRSRRCQSSASRFTTGHPSYAPSGRCWL